MAKYNWEDFKKNTIFIELEKFFRTLYDKTESHDEFVYIFISANSFALFLLLKKKGLLNIRDFPVYSFEYIEKSIDLEFLKRKKIILVDDVIHTGKHLQKCYDILKKNISPISSDKIETKIFMGEKGKAALRQKRNIADIFHEDNIWLLKSANDILEFTSIQALLFYQEEIPFVPALPVMKVVPVEEQQDTLKKEEFQQIIKGNNSWKYYECPQMGYLQNNLTSGILILKNNILSLLYNNFIAKMTVMVNFIFSAGEMKVTFYPCVYLKSILFSELLEYFNCMFGETNYGRCINEYVKKMSNIGSDNIYQAVYSAIRYSLNLYIGMELKTFVKTSINREIRFENSNLDAHFEKDFKEDIIDNTLKFSKLYYIERLLEKRTIKLNLLKVERKEFINCLKREYSFQNSCFLLHEIINEICHQQTSDEHGDTFKLEEFEQAFKKYLVVNEDEDMRDYIVRGLSNFFNLGNISFDAYYDKKSTYFYSGFKIGENSDAFYDISAKVFFAGVLAYYKKIGVNYKNKYTVFIMYLLAYFKKDNLMDGFITKDEFEFYEKYFSRAGEEGFEYQIENKEFLIRDEIPYHIKIVREYIESLQFN